ncbi:uncharacterized protein LOC129974965 isoform X3 [Argiope bruennichi]|uniref:uncharacterized protein LOC129974965 isoform X3 n=1 Tax=Argiope bruennichi TaxID=94029 RepID=UPI002494291E|nr:uncharacterized protein LOC129974965 isoform X3 [Argiope bruennichi]
MDYRRGTKARLYPSATRKKRTGKNLAEWREKLKAKRGCLENTSPDEPAETLCGSSDNHQTSKDITLTGRRIIDVGYFFNRLREINNHGPSNCSLSNMTVVSETKEGLRTGIELRCSVCFFTEIVWSENTDSSKVPVNAAAVSGITTMGGGYSNLEDILSAMDIPSITSCIFQKERDLISAAREETAAKEIQDAALEKKPLLTMVADDCLAKRSYRTNYTSLSAASSGTVAKEAEKKDHIPIEPTVEIKEEPTDYASNPSTSSNNINEEFILPHEESSWTASDTVVEPQFTLSVASLSSPNGPETSDGEQLKKKRKPNPNRVSTTTTFVPPVKNGPEMRQQSPVYNFDDFPMPSSLSKEPPGEFSSLGPVSKEPRKDQFDVFGEYIAAKLRSLDRRSCAFAQKAIGDIIFEAEMGKYLTDGRNRSLMTQS